MLKVYDPLEYEMTQRFRDHEDIRSICYASELMEHFDFSEKEMDEAISRAFKACYSLHIPINENFRSVYLSSDEHVVTDWRLSPLACYLLIINADPAKAEIAQLQLIFATKKFKDVNIF
jgi:DNA-damage-inducible protein D